MRRGRRGAGGEGDEEWGGDEEGEGKDGGGGRWAELEQLVPGASLGLTAGLMRR